MNITKRFLLLTIAAITAVLLCSCARNSMWGTRDASRDVARRGRNFIDSGINAVENGIENGANTITGGMYGANSGYSGNAAIGTGGTTYTNEGTATEISPTLRSKARSMNRERQRTDDKTNSGEVNSNNGNADGGLGSNNSDR